MAQKRTPKVAWSIQRLLGHDYVNQYPQKLRCECTTKPALWNLAGSDTALVCSSCGHERF
jgi:hypothetical protein